MLAESLTITGGIFGVALVLMLAYLGRQLAKSANTSIMTAERAIDDLWVLSWAVRSHAKDAILLPLVISRKSKKNVVYHGDNKDKLMAVSKLIGWHGDDLGCPVDKQWDRPIATVTSKAKSNQLWNSIPHHYDVFWRVVQFAVPAVLVMKTVFSFLEIKNF